MNLAQKLYEAMCEKVFPLSPVVPWYRMPASQQGIYEHLVDVAATALAGSDAATANAKADALADALDDLLPAIDAERADRKGIEYTTAEQQARMRRTTRLLNRAKAALVEVRER